MTYGFYGEGMDDKTGTFALATLKDTETIAPARASGHQTLRRLAR